MSDETTERPQLRDYYKDVELLLKAGADINARDRYNRSPYHLPVREGNKKMMALLVKHSAHEEAESYIIPDYSH